MVVLGRGAFLMSEVPLYGPSLLEKRDHSRLGLGPPGNLERV